MAVYKRNNVWYIDYYIKVNGKRERRREPVSPRRDEAEARLKEYREIVKAGKDPKTTIEFYTNEDHVLKPFEIIVPMLTQFVQIFLKLHGNLKSNKTLVSYKNSLNHLLPVFGKKRLNTITKVIVKTYMANRGNERASNSTINNEIACIKCILSRAVEWEYIKKNPLLGLKMLQEPPAIVRYLTSEGAKRLIQVSPQHLRDVIVLALGTGMRKSEIFTLTWNDIMINEEFRCGEITVIGKGNKQRTIRMNKTVYNLLIRKSEEKDSQYVFPSKKTGKHLTDVKHSFTSALKKAGIQNFRFHDLRHTAASWMVQGGASLYAVQKILGHSSIRTTQRYAHLSPGYLESEIGKIDDFLLPENEVKKELTEPISESVV